MDDRHKVVPKKVFQSSNIDWVEDYKSWEAHKIQIKNRDYNAWMKNRDLTKEEPLYQEWLKKIYER